MKRIKLNLIMIIKEKVITTIVFFLITFAYQSNAQIHVSELLGGENNPIHSTVPFLTIAPDSRGGGLGDAGVATSPDIYSQHWNAAKYAFIKKKIGISISYTPWLRNLVNDINLAYLTGYFCLDELQVISGSLRFFSLGDIQFTDEFGGDIGRYNPNEFAIDLGYSRKFTDRFSSALTLRFIRSDITGGGVSYTGSQYNPGISFAADLSAYYQKAFTLSEKKGEYAWGIAFTNLGTKISYSEDSEKQFIPANMRIGGRVTIDMDDYNKLSLCLDVNKLLVPTPIKKVGDTLIYGKTPPNSLPLSWIQSFYDAPGGFKEELHELMFSGGIEYWYLNQFALRAGHFNEHKTKGNRKYFTIGVGFKLNLINIDISYLVPTSGRNNPLANTIRFSIAADFDSPKNKKQ